MPHQITIETPVGWIVIEAQDDYLTKLYWLAPDIPTEMQHPHPLLKEAEKQIHAYFSGQLKNFDLPIVPSNTARGKVLREAIIAVPYGQTETYAEVARRIGSAPRAIGQACARNPVPIIIPCHRILSAGGITGHYSGGNGTVTKRALLTFENPSFV